jgi:hypothetical protein
MRNLQEERHRPAKYICHGRRGELREKYHAGMEDQLGARPRRQLRRSMDTVYLDRILATPRESGSPVLDEDVLRIHPHWYAHINVHGHDSFQPLHLAEGMGRRPLRDPGKAHCDEE